MKKLIISANPSSKGFTHTITEKLNELSLQKWDQVEIIDLYKSPLRQDFLSYENLSEMGQDEKVKAIQEKITWADELIFVFPIWWGDMPAIMKNFWDNNFTTGFAYKYEKGGKQVGLLTGKTARIIATSGAPSFFYSVILHIQILWNLNRISFCGMKQKSFTILGDIDRTRTDKNKLLAKIEKLV